MTGAARGDAVPHRHGIDARRAEQPGADAPEAKTWPAGARPGDTRTGDARTGSGPAASEPADFRTLFPAAPALTRLRGRVTLGAFLLLTAFGMPFQVAALALRARGARRWIPFAYHRLVCRIFGIRLTVHGAPARRDRVLFVANHCSWLDIMVLSAAAPVSFVAKHEVADWPFFGLLAKLQRTVFIERDRRGEAGRHRDAIRARLAAGDNLVLFPEGTSSDGNGVLPFKSALFSVAEAQGEPGDARPTVQPVSLAYTGRCGLPMQRRERPFVAWYGDMALPPHLWDVACRGPLEVVIVFHPPLDPEQTRTRKTMAAAAHDRVARGLSQALAGRTGTEPGTEPGPAAEMVHESSRALAYAVPRTRLDTGEAVVNVPTVQGQA